MTKTEKIKKIKSIIRKFGSINVVEIETGCIPVNSKLYIAELYSDSIGMTDQEDIDIDSFEPVEVIQYENLTDKMTNDILHILSDYTKYLN